MSIIVIVGIVIGGILVKFIADTKADLKSFEVVPFHQRFYILTELFSLVYFNNKCSVHKTTNTEIRIIGDGINANKMIQIYYARKTLCVEIKKKLFQIEYQQKYTLKDSLLKTDEALVNFGEKCLEDFYNYIEDKTEF